jgi:hypothetical protein
MGLGEGGFGGVGRWEILQLVGNMEKFMEKKGAGKG